MSTSIGFPSASSACAVHPNCGRLSRVDTTRRENHSGILASRPGSAAGASADADSTSALVTATTRRSEERRVGKECRGGGGREQREEEHRGKDKRQARS